MNKTGHHHQLSLTAILALFWIYNSSLLPAAEDIESADARASAILKATDLRGGLIVHLGCGDGRLTAALCAGAGYLVHGLDTGAADIENAREHVRSLGLYGRVSIDRFDGRSSAAVRRWHGEPSGAGCGMRDTR
ncbi:MAG: class I SAM-dependent methyltransferase [Pirellulaceae bacterium]|nr:class I SAM-dependent methyltransferase [Pirellulaceae bacterium]